MDRKEFLTLAKSGINKDDTYILEKYPNPYQNTSLPKDLETATTSVAPYTGTWNKRKAAHLLRRTLFGFNLSELNQFSGMTMNQAVNSILNVTNYNPTPPVNNYNNPNHTDPNIPLGQVWVNDTIPGQGNIRVLRYNSFRAWVAGQIVTQESNIREKMTVFWHNHFATEMEFVTDPRLAYKMNQLLRVNCLGNFKQLVKDVTKDPCMLVYLNGYKNTKTAPDENYARELFELFTLGKGPDSQYTEHDVITASRVLTGWRINFSTQETFFQASFHDTDNKTFSTFFDTKVITGKTGLDGADETDELVDMIFEKEQVLARFICRKIYRFFCYYLIEPSVETNVIHQLAQTFINSNWEIKPVLEQLFKSEHFYDQNSKACHIKNPYDYIVGFGKLLEAEMPTDLAPKYAAWRLVHQFSASQGMNYGDPPSVSGWPAYHQEPKYHQFWINSDTLTKRKQISEAILLPNGLNIEGTYIKIDPIAFVEKLQDPHLPTSLINQCCDLFYAYEPSQAKKDEMRGILLSGQDLDIYWTAAWNDYKNNPSDQTKKLIVYVRLFLFFQYILALPEYQLA